MRNVTVPVVLALLFLACEEDSTSPGGLLLDGGRLDGATEGGAGPSDSGSPGDGGDRRDGGGDAGMLAVAPVTCAAPVRIDSLRGVSGSVPIGLGYSGDRWMVLWTQISAVSPDSQFHVKARGFNGTALTAEQTVSTDSVGTVQPIVVDGAGRGFTQFYADSVPGYESRIDFTTMSFVDKHVAPFQNLLDPLALAPIASGGAMSVYRTSSGISADLWDPNQSVWKTANLTGPTPAYGLKARSNASGSIAVSWYVSDGASGSNVTVSTWSGNAWKTNTRAFTVDSGLSPSNFELVELANGDVVYLWLVGGRYVKTTTYHPGAAAGTEWDAPTQLEDAGPSGSVARPHILVDAADRITTAWINGSNVYARRFIGGGWTDRADLGAAESVSLHLEPSSNVSALLFHLGEGITLRRIAAADTGTTWTAKSRTGVGVSNGTDLDRMSGLVFDHTGRPTVITQQDNPPGDAGTIGLGLVYTTCQ